MPVLQVAISSSWTVSFARAVKTDFGGDCVRWEKRSVKSTRLCGSSMRQDGNDMTIEAVLA